MARFIVSVVFNFLRIHWYNNEKISCYDGAIFFFFFFSQASAVLAVLCLQYVAAQTQYFQIGGGRSSGRDSYGGERRVVVRESHICKSTVSVYAFLNP
jgi:hypothetical protein